MPSPVDRKDRWHFYAVFACFVCLATGVALTRMPWCDEGWFFDPIFNWFHHGETGTSILVGKGLMWDGLERYTYWVPPVFFLLEAAWMKLFGLNLIAFRMFSVAAGTACLACWISFLRSSGFGRAPLLLAAALIASDYGFVTRAADGRMDMLSAAFSIAALASYLHWRELSFNTAIFLSQTLVVLSGLTHPIGGVISFVNIVVLVTLERDWKQIRFHHIALAFIPYILGAFGWGLYIAKDPALFKRLFFSNATGRIKLFSSPLEAVRDEFLLRYLGPYGLASTQKLAKFKLLIPPIYFCAALLATFLAALRQALPVRRLLWITAATFLVLFVLDGNKSGLYLVYILPLFAALLASVICHYWSYTTHRPLVAAFTVLFVLLQLSGSLFWIATNPYKRQYVPLTAFIRTHVNASAITNGSAELGFGLGFDNVRDDQTLGFYGAQMPSAIVVDPRYTSWFDGFRTKRPDVYQFVQKRLSCQFNRAYSGGGYAVYLPANVPCGSP